MSDQNIKSEERVEKGTRPYVPGDRKQRESVRQRIIKPTTKNPKRKRN